MQTPAPDARQLLHLTRTGLGIRVAWVNEKPDRPCVGNDFAEQFQSLRRKLPAQAGHARNVAARPVEAGDKADPDWITSHLKDDRYGSRRNLYCESRIDRFGGDD